MNVDRALVYHLLEQSAFAYDEVPKNCFPLDDGQSKARGFCVKTVAGGLIAFAGSESILDWLTDFHCIQMPYPYGGMVHRGFYGEWLKVFGQITDYFFGLPKHYPIQITGHSLGGALATLAQDELAKTMSFDTTLVTFGSPRVFDSTAAKACNRRAITSIRIQHHNDLVPRVPKLNYRHIGDLRRIDDDGKEIRFSGILGALERLVEVGKADLCFSAGRDHLIGNYLPAVKAWKEAA